MSDDVPAPTFGPRMVCTRCGIIGPHARPNVSLLQHSASEVGQEETFWSPICCDARAFHVIFNCKLPAGGAEVL